MDIQVEPEGEISDSNVEYLDETSNADGRGIKKFAQLFIEEFKNATSGKK